jgi:hypothetical protein
VEYAKAISRILAAEDTDVDFSNVYDAFLEPIASMMVNVSIQSSAMDSKLAMERAWRFIRGFLTTVVTKKQFESFWKWFHPQKAEMLLASIRVWHSDNRFLSASLKLVQEVVMNRTQRLNFDVGIFELDCILGNRRF